MIVIRFKAPLRPDRVDEALAAFEKVVRSSRQLEGVISFDIARDLTDPNCVIAVEVFEDQAAVDRQEALPEVGSVMSLLPEMLAGPPEATQYQVSSAANRM